MFLKVTHSVILIACSLAAAQAQTTQHPPSTPEGRAKMVEVAKSLEAEPLGPQSTAQRKWAIVWLVEVPDISVKVCGNLLGPVLQTKKNNAPEIFAQLLPSEAAFVISNPDKAKDDVAVYMAGVEGALRAYENILKAKPKGKFPFLDDLIEKRNQSHLLEYVQSAAARCK
jgi:hypothetical protein